MDRAKYLEVQRQLVRLAGEVRDMPLGEFLLAIDHADTVGPILHPSLWIDGHSTMMRFRDLAEALLPFRNKAVGFFDEVGDSE